MTTKKPIKKTTKKRWTYNKNKKESVQKVLLALKNWLSRESACAVSWVARRTFYSRLEDDKFRTEVEDSEEYRMWVVEKAKFDLIKKGHRPAIEKELKSKNREVYWDKSEVNNTGDFTIEIKRYDKD